tara:strand:- start:5370 stop:5945 length:576 start_codon:yes stop_codon:yes gene_type:complete
MIKNKLISILVSLIIISLLSSCGIYRRADVKDVPVNVEERAKRNVQEGRGIRFGGSNKGGDFDFASSNNLWRASVEILDFVPLTNASYSGGIIITDWFSAEKNTENSTRDLKITIRFLTNEIRADAVDVTIFEKICSNGKCDTNKVESKLETEIKLAILKKAVLLEKQSEKKYFETTGKKRGKTIDSGKRK